MSEYPRRRITRFPASRKTFDPELVCCRVKNRLQLGESPQALLDELKGCQVIDIDALRTVVTALAPARSAERPQDRR